MSHKESYLFLMEKSKVQQRFLVHLSVFQR